MYLTYEEYNSFGGNITPKEFNLKSIKSKQIIDKYTDKFLIGITNVPIEVKTCMFEIIFILSKKSNDDNISSERVGNWSANYREVNYSKEIDDVLSLYLDDLEINGKKIMKGISLYV